MRRWLRTSSPLLLLTVALSVPWPTAHAQDAPLRLEDVVRRFVTGASSQELIDWINASEVSFETDEEMLNELRAAGLSQGVIDAMVARQAAQDALTAAPGEEPAEPVDENAGTLVRFHLNPDEIDEEKRRLRIPDSLPPELARAWSIDPGSDKARITDVGLYVICRTSYHVPDHWRSKTRLGRDFVSAPRHRMLAFVPGAEATEAGVLLFELPLEVEVELEPEDSHDLSLGIALQAGGRFYRLLDAGLDALAVGRDVLDFQVAIDGLRQPNNLKIEIEPLPDGPPPRPEEPAVTVDERPPGCLDTGKVSAE